jgi:SAM-dependent methyltransferase
MMTGVMEWQGRTGDSWAVEWRRTDRSFHGLTDHLLQRTRGISFTKVLDIGCGAGELSLALGRGRGNVEVRGVDISPQLVEVAVERAIALPNVSFTQGDAAVWTPGDGFVPDLLVSRHGVMFFHDPVAAFRNLHDIAAPGANLLFSCFRSPAENEIFTGVGSILPPPASLPDPNAPGPMAFADTERVRSILSSAGWKNIEFESFDFAMVAGVGEGAVDDAVGYFLKIGPVAAVLADMNDEEERERLVWRLRKYLCTKERDGIVALGAAAWIVSAQCS